jgi:hypothetical protein
MTNHDDSDMKIFNPGTDCPEEDANDLGNLAALLECHRQNGNTEKAKSLGERLAVLTPDTSSGIDLYDLLEGADLPDEVMNQVRILLVFTAQNTLHEQLCPPLLSSCAVNAMYDKLVETEPAFYDGISDGALSLFTRLVSARARMLTKTSAKTLRCCAEMKTTRRIVYWEQKPTKPRVP